MGLQYLEEYITTKEEIEKKMSVTYRKFRIRDCVFAYLLVSGEKEVLERNFRQIMVDVMTNKYIIMLCNKRIGMLIVKNHELGIIIKTKERRKHFAYSILKKFIEENKDFYFVKINKRNTMSIKLFEKLDFVKYCSMQSYIYFVYKNSKINGYTKR